jgi:hypothetical protein
MQWRHYQPLHRKVRTKQNYYVKETHTLRCVPVYMSHLLCSVLGKASEGVWIGVGIGEDAKEIAPPAAPPAGLGEGIGVLHQPLDSSTIGKKIQPGFSKAVCDRMHYRGACSAPRFTPVNAASHARISQTRL